MAHLTQSQVERLWHEFKVESKSEARSALIQNYAYLVKITSGRVVSSMPNGLDRDDLVSAGTIGLVKAVDQFDTGREVKFETYAIALIRGAILEMLRGEDWVPRSVREKLKALDKVIVDLEARLGRPATPEEMAQELQVPVEDVHSLLQQSARTGVLSLDDAMAGYDGEEHLHFLDLLVDENASPEQEAEGREIRRILGESVDKLPDRERLVIALYYSEGLTFKEIGRVLGVSESRVYQLHTQAMTRIRAHMQAEGGVYAAF
jgi:RNA polymerase sigma factor for flagellar operon FliA